MDDSKQKYIKKLEEISHVSIEEAKKILVEQARNEAKADIARIIRESEEEARLTSSKRAREILGDALAHGALEIVPEYTVSIIKIQEEDIKGRIIGKEGRNIRAFENATGVEKIAEEAGIFNIHP